MVDYTLGHVGDDNSVTLKPQTVRPVWGFFLYSTGIVCVLDIHAKFEIFQKTQYVKRTDYDGITFENYMSTRSTYFGISL